MSSNEKVSNALGDSKEAVGTALFTENKSLTKDAEKGIGRVPSQDVLFALILWYAAKTIYLS